MHSIHDTTIRQENDRKREVRRFDQAAMFDDGAASGRRFKTKPERLVQFSDLAQQNSKARKILAQRDEPVHIPRQKAALRWTEVILFSHCTRCEATIRLSLSLSHRDIVETCIARVSAPSLKAPKGNKQVWWTAVLPDVLTGSGSLDKLQLDEVHSEHWVFDPAYATADSYRAYFFRRWALLATASKELANGWLESNARPGDVSVLGRMSNLLISVDRR